MKFNKDKIKEETESNGYGDFDILDKEHLTGVEEETGLEMAEVELVLAEPTKMVDADGSVVLAEPGDIVHIQSESLKRIKKV